MLGYKQNHSMKALCTDKGCEITSIGNSWYYLWLEWNADKTEQDNKYHMIYELVIG